MGLAMKSNNRARQPMLFLSENLIEVRPESLLFRVFGPFLPSLLASKTISFSKEDPHGF